MATQSIVKSTAGPAAAPRGLAAAILLAGIVTIVLVMGMIALANNAPAATPVALAAQSDALREFRQGEIGATTSAVSPVDALREFRQEEVGATGGGASDVDTLREHRREEIGVH